MCYKVGPFTVSPGNNNDHLIIVWQGLSLTFAFSYLSRSTRAGLTRRDPARLSNLFLIFPTATPTHATQTFPPCVCLVQILIQSPYWSSYHTLILCGTSIPLAEISPARHSAWFSTLSDPLAPRPPPLTPRSSQFPESTFNQDQNGSDSCARGDREETGP